VIERAAVEAKRERVAEAKRAAARAIMVGAAQVTDGESYKDTATFTRIERYSVVVDVFQYFEGSNVGKPILDAVVRPSVTIRPCYRMTMAMYGIILYVILALVLLTGEVDGMRAELGFVALPRSKISLLRRSPRLASDSLLARPYTNECSIYFSGPPRIRFIRISDLCVTQAPWCLVPVLTNLFHSMVFRYQDMAEKAMESSPFVDTVTIRPGDLVDDERDVATTSLQVDCRGSVPCPARVGREDVAALAVSAALFDSTEELAEIEHKPFHYTFACRWTSETMDPYPPQGQKSDGHISASEGLQSAPAPPDLTNGGVTSLATEPRGDMAVQSRSNKPYGIFVALTAYTVFWCILRSVHYYTLPILFPGLKAKSWSLHPWRILHGLSASALGGLQRLWQGCISFLAFPTWIPRPIDTKYIPF
jgi:hypothetical protein